MTRRNVQIAVGFVIVLGLGAWFLLMGSKQQFADADNVELVRMGEAVYDEHCASCHGENREGQPNWRERDDQGFLPAPPHDGTGHTWHHADDLLFKITKEGTASIAPPDYNSHMQGYGDILTDTQIWAVLAYIKSKWPERQRESQERINQSYNQ